MFCVSRRMGILTLDTLGHLPQRCRGCVFWELSPDCTAVCDGADYGLDKEAWVSATLLDWGSCGRIAYVDEQPVGFVSYAAPRYVPRSAEFPTGPASPDAALLMTAHVAENYARTGLGRMLVQACAADLAERGIGALEAFGDSRGESGACVVPSGFFHAVGFRTIRSHPHYPRLRLDLAGPGGWGAGTGTADLEADAWLASLNPRQVADPMLYGRI